MSRRKPKPPPYPVPLPCVIVAVDPGRSSGWATYLEGQPVSYGTLDAADRGAIGRVLLDACRLAHAHKLPLVLLGETWNTGGRMGGAQWQGLGAAWGSWRFEAETLNKRQDADGLGPQLVPSRILRVSTSTWRARFGMCRAPKGSPKDWHKTRAIEVVREQLGVTVPADQHDGAEALLIGLWGARAAAVGAKLPKRVMVSRGLYREAA